MSDEFTESAPCPCPVDCTRKDDCKACVAHHTGQGQQPYCQAVRNEQGQKSLFKKVLAFLSYLFCPT